MRHPEQRKDEIFVGNISVIGQGFIEPYLPQLKTARLGEIAYAIDGEALSPDYPDYMRPFFIGLAESDRYNAIRMEILRKINRGEL